MTFHTLPGRITEPMNSLLLCVLVLVLQGAQEPSNPPAPSNGEPQRPQQDKAASEPPEHAPVKPSRPGPGISGSETDPVPDSVAFDKRDHEENYQEPAANKWHNWTLIFFTAVLAGATIALVWVTKRLKEAASEQNQILSKRHNLAEKEFRLRRTIFYAENRPRIGIWQSFLGKVSENGEIRVIEKLEEILDGNHQARFVLRNTGNTPGTLTHSSIYLWVIEYGDNRTLHPRWTPMDAKTIHPGESFAICLNPRPEVSRDEFRETIFRGGDALFIGSVKYKDPLGGTRETGFCRRFNPNTEQLEQIENSEYDYET